MTRKLKSEYQQYADDFEVNYKDIGCHCHEWPPCYFCTHPGNPLNLEENDDAWEEVLDGNVLVYWDEHQVKCTPLVMSFTADRDKKKGLLRRCMVIIRNILKISQQPERDNNEN